MQVIFTKYYGPTNTKGSRIKAWTSGGKVMWFEYYDVGCSHENAAKILKDEMKWESKMCGGHTKDGMVFVFADDIVI